MENEVDLDRFDGLIIHYSLVACLDTFIGPRTRKAIRAFRGFKIAFVQDDYRFVNATNAALADLGIHAVFGLAPIDIIDQVYSPTKLPGVVRETVLAGYVPEGLCDRRVPRYEDRPIDVGYRARKVPPWLGSFSREKWIIAERFAKDATPYGLTCNLSTREEDRIYGEAWISFMTNSKAMLGTESGASVCDYTGEIQANVEAHLLREPGASFERLSDLYFKDIDGQVMLNVISPRCFEAAALRTLMILYEGSYSGRLQAWRHYVPLKKDHSNMAEVVAILRDPAKANAIIDRAYREVSLNPDNSFAAMVKQVDRVIDAHFRPDMLATAAPYDDATMAAIQRRADNRQWRRRMLRKAAGGVRRAAHGILDLLPEQTANTIRPILQARWRAILGIKLPPPTR